MGGLIREDTITEIFQFLNHALHKQRFIFRACLAGDWLPYQVSPFKARGGKGGGIVIFIGGNTPVQSDSAAAVNLNGPSLSIYFVLIPGRLFTGSQVEIANDSVLESELNHPKAPLVDQGLDAFTGPAA